MKTVVKDWQNKEVGSLELKQDVFGLPARKDILSRVVHWQLAKRQAGTHKTKTISEISGTTKKPHKQKGTGQARQGSLRSAQMRGGATIFGPVVRSHAYSLPKRIRRLGLKTALSVKLAAGQLIIVDNLKVTPKAKELADIFQKMGLKSVLIIGGNELDENFVKAASNLPHVDVLPVVGANVYDILRRETLILSKDAVKLLEGRLTTGEAA